MDDLPTDGFGAHIDSVSVDGGITARSLTAMTARHVRDTHRRARATHTCISAGSSVSVSHHMSSTIPTKSSMMVRSYTAAEWCIWMWKEVEKKRQDSAPPAKMHQKM
jgi:hypothetical protein